MTNHVPTLETCQKLKAAGFPQESYFLWMIWNEPQLIATEESKGYAMDKFEHCAAPLLTEILEQLPPGLNHNTLVLTKESGYSLGYIGFDNKGKRSSSDNPAEAASLLWLELKEASD